MNRKFDFVFAKVSRGFGSSRLVILACWLVGLESRSDRIDECLLMVSALESGGTHCGRGFNDNIVFKSQIEINHIRKCDKDFGV